MITFAFITVAIIDILMLLALLGVIYKKNTDDKDLDNVLDALILGLLIGIVVVITLSIFLIV